MRKTKKKDLWQVHSFFERKNPRKDENIRVQTGATVWHWSSDTPHHRQRFNTSQPVVVWDLWPDQGFYERGDIITSWHSSMAAAYLEGQHALACVVHKEIGMFPWRIKISGVAEQKASCEETFPFASLLWRLLLTPCVLRSALAFFFSSVLCCEAGSHRPSSQRQINFQGGFRNDLSSVLQVANDFL